MNIAVIGLGKLGSVLAAVLANAGHPVTGIDRDPSAVDAINAGKAPVPETGLDDLIAALAPGWLEASTDYAAVARSEMSIIVVPTPSDCDGRFVNDYVLDAIDNIGRHITGSWHTVVVCSTVMPGSMGDVIRPALERASGRVVGSGLGLAYSPEFIALGSVVHDMRNPDAVFVGAEDKRSFWHVRDMVGSYVQSNPTVHQLRFNEAELAKIAVNTYITMKISYANMIAAVCEQLPGANAHTVLAAVGDDSRIGTSYLRPGASFGGPCFPRDNRAFMRVAHGELTTWLPAATNAVNEGVTNRVYDMLAGHQHVAILGLSYKPATSVVEESMGASIAETLAWSGITVKVHDPQARPPLEGVQQCDTIDEALEGATIVLVATPWPEYADVDFDGRIIIDAWDCTKPQANRRVLGEHCCWWAA